MSDPRAARPFPVSVAPDFADFFAGLARRQLTIRQCTDCEAIQWPPRLRCANCAARTFRPRTISDHGVVHTFTVCHRAFDPWFAARVPFGVVVADLEAGIRLTGGYLGDDLDALGCGMPVRAEYVADGERTWLGWVPEPRS